MVTEDYLIRKYLPVPYKHQGRSLEGFDCWGLILFVYKELGYKLWDIEEDYDIKWGWKDKHLFIENYHREWDKVKKPNLFDVVLFKNSKGVAFHAGIMLSNSRFLHCCKVGTVVGRLSEQKWATSIEGFYHLRERK